MRTLSAGAFGPGPRRAKAFFLGGAALALAVLAPAWAATAPEQPAPKLEKDIAYRKTPDGQELKLDFIRPASGEGPFPLVIWLHGGGWRTGDRKEYHPEMSGMAKLGWAGATVEYRLAPKHKHPAQIEDARMALAFLRANAKKYNIDADRIAVAGRSAGGHLALLLGLAPDENGKSAPGIRAVVNFFGITDLSGWRINAEGEKVMRQFSPAGLDGIIKDFLGTSDRKAAVTAEASPVTHVRKGSPAVLTLHGSVDKIVPVQQAQALHEALRQAGVPEKLVVLDGKGHGFDHDDAEHGFGPKGPSRAVSEMIEFLNRHARQTPESGAPDSAPIGGGEKDSGASEGKGMDNR